MPRLRWRVRAPFPAPLKNRAAVCRFFIQDTAPWPSGKARVCKTLIPGSIPGGASKTSPKNLSVLGLFSILPCAHLPNWTQSGHSFSKQVSIQKTLFCEHTAYVILLREYNRSRSEKAPAEVGRCFSSTIILSLISESNLRI